MDPALPKWGIHRVSIKAINYVFGNEPWQNTGLGITLEPLRKPSNTSLWNYNYTLGIYWANGAQFIKGVNRGAVINWNVGNVVTMVVDMDRGNFWWEVDGQKVSVIYDMDIPKGERANVHFIMDSHLMNAEVEIVDRY